MLPRELQVPDDCRNSQAESMADYRFLFYSCFAFGFFAIAPIVDVVVPCAQPGRKLSVCACGWCERIVALRSSPPAWCAIYVGDVVVVTSAVSGRPECVGWIVTAICCHFSRARQGALQPLHPVVQAARRLVQHRAEHAVGSAHHPVHALHGMR